MKKSTPRASKRIKSSPEIRYVEPAVSDIHAELVFNKSAIRLRCAQYPDYYFSIKHLTGIIDALTRIEKQLYYQGLGLK